MLSFQLGKRSARFFRFVSEGNFPSRLVRRLITYLLQLENMDLAVYILFADQHPAIVSSQLGNELLRGGCLCRRSLEEGSCR
jgi:hypothetical protein